MNDKIRFWLAYGEGAIFTWADFGRHYRWGFFWSCQLRGERQVECTFKPQKLLEKSR